MSNISAEIVCVRITPPNEKAPGQLAQAELVFGVGAGPLNGWKLIGFAIWERRSGGGLNVTFPARQYSVNGERRSFALFRPVMDGISAEAVRDLILEAYSASLAQTA